jgi:ABC-2 type transport system ATP-binding protein
MAAILRFEHLSKRYATQTVLNDCSLSVQAGEFFALVGVNGAGKTTLIKSLLDFCELNHGEIYICGQSHLQPQARRHLAFLPEQFRPPSYLTGEDFLKYITSLHGQSYDAAKVFARCVQLDLAPSALSQTVRTYSKGMAQKLGLLGCFLSEKPLLVLDEPMAGLDPKARAYLKHYLLKLKQQGTTLFFSTHLLADVEALCDRMAILHAGRLQFVGSPAVCCAHYHTDNLEEAYLRCIGAMPEMRPESTPLSPPP